jgi:NAD(P)-dependent dehydrogenase (short-subunit alcohol dehydrogenase family)
MISMNGNTVLVTGASRGIGLALANIFLANCYRVIGTCRAGHMDTIKHENFEAWALDLSTPDDIKRFEQEFAAKGIRINILINNAGVGPDLNQDLPDEETFAQTFAVNLNGTVFFTEQMLRHISSGGKIINISSRMGSINHCVSSDAVAYRTSKAALNMYSKILTNRLAGRQLVATMHPGWVKTTIAGPEMHGRLTAQESALRIFEFAVSDFKHGIFWNVETGSECEW